MSMKYDGDLQPKSRDGCNWVAINGTLLLIAGVVCFIVFLEFGTKGYSYVIPGAITVVSLVGLIHWLALRGQTTRDSKWVGATVAAWATPFIAILLVLGSAVVHLPYMSQVPTGGAGVIFYCLVSMAIGPIVVVGVMVFFAVLGEV